MPSALILSGHDYPAMLLAEQLGHRWSVDPGPLVLRATLRKFPAPTWDRDRTVSRTLVHDYSWRRLYLHPLSRGWRMII